MTTDTAVLDRATGALLGVHAGDSLGATTEFGSPNPNPDTWVRDIVGGGPFNWEPGQPTDDTDLTAAVVRAYTDLIADGTEQTLDAVLDACGRHFLAWYRSGPKDIGGTTAHSLGRLRRTNDPRSSGNTAADAQANGSLMRCIATAVYRKDDPDQLRAESRAISAVTHASGVCMDACELYNRAVADVINGTDIRSAITDAAAALDGTEVGRVAASRLAAPTDAPMPWRRGGWVLTALDIAMWAALRTDATAEDLLVDIINRGGDADTNGAIAGGILGARDGASALPDRWVATLGLADEFRAAATTFLAG